MPTVKTIEMSQQETQSLARTSQSINHWAHRLAELSLEQKGALSTLQGLYDSRAALMDSVVTREGMDRARIQSFKVVGNQVTILLADEDPPEAVPSEEAGPPG
jgi:hypothetical protein